MANKLSRLISYILHPLLIPFIGVAILLFGHTIMSAIAINAKLFLLGVVLLNTFIIPGIFIMLLSQFKIIPNLSLQTRKERIIPMIAVAVSYIVCALMLRDVMMAFLIRRFLIAALGCILFATVVTLFWQISLHMTAIGGILAMLIVLNTSGFGQMLYFILAFIVLCGALASARLQLGKHNPWQIIAGLSGGFTIALASLLLL